MDPKICHCLFRRRVDQRDGDELGVRRPPVGQRDHDRLQTHDPAGDQSSAGKREPVNSFTSLIGL
jgi:hypothetical protein